MRARWKIDLPSRARSEKSNLLAKNARHHFGVDPDVMSVTLTVAELRRLVRAEVAAALREHAGATPGPVLLDRRQLAAALGVSVPTVDRLRAQGCPTVSVQQAVRFELESVIGWLQTRRPELRVVGR